MNRAGAGVVDLSLLTDGLKAEREQGITIDVAYRYFSTAKRKFIIADTPGHEQYTRNMATGASTADVAIVLIDAKAFVKLGNAAAAVASAYLYRELAADSACSCRGEQDGPRGLRCGEVFERIRAEFRALAAKLGLQSVEVIPISALVGDNVVEPSAAMPWYSGADAAGISRNGAAAG